MESSTHSSCLECAHRAARHFCALSGDAIREFDDVKESLVFDKGELLFGEGRPARGVYLLCEGRAKLSVSSESGERLMLRVAGAGEFLGLEAALRGEDYDFSAELLDNARIAYIKRKDLLKFLRDNPVVCMAVVSRLSEHLHGAYEHVRSIGLNRARRIRPERTQSLACSLSR
jgi:CRP/FNR family transcriptional regulator, cyclic AMP receptor protein